MSHFPIVSLFELYSEFAEITRFCYFIDIAIPVSQQRRSLTLSQPSPQCLLQSRYDAFKATARFCRYRLLMIRFTSAPRNRQIKTSTENCTLVIH